MKKLLTLPVLLACLIFMSACGQQTDSSANSEPKSETSMEKEVQVEIVDELVMVEMMLYFGEEPQVEEVAVIEGSDLYEGMLSLETEGVNMEFKEYPGLGSLLIQLGDLKNDPDAGAFWVFCVNGVQSSVGINEVKLAEGDQIAWHYVKGHNAPCKQVGE